MAHHDTELCQDKLLACSVRFHRRKIRADEIPIFSLYQLPQVIHLLVLLRLAVLLNQKRRDDFVPEFAATASSQQKALKKIAFRLDCPGIPDVVP